MFWTNVFTPSSSTYVHMRLFRYRNLEFALLITYTYYTLGITKNMDKYLPTVNLGIYCISSNNLAVILSETYTYLPTYIYLS